MVTKMNNFIGVYGFVRSYFTQRPIASVNIQINPMNVDGTTKPSVPVTVVSDNSGFFQAELQNGLYKMSIIKDIYDKNEYVIVINNNAVLQDILLASIIKIDKIKNNGGKEKKLRFSEIFEDAD